MFVGLSLEQAPPFSAPLKFFLTAPIFSLLASLVILFNGTITIHEPSTIALLHTITIGFMIMVMFGALQQMLPVVAGAVIKNIVFVSNFVYIFLIVGIISLFFGFYLYEKIFIFIAVTSLSLAILFFIFATLKELIKIKQKSYIIIAMILSISFLFFAFLIATHLSISHATSNISDNHYSFALLHYNLIFFGWIFMLIVGITFQVVPMFWVATAYTQKEQKIIIYTIFTLLIFYIINTFLALELGSIFKLFMSGIAFYYIYLTGKKLQNRKRKLRDESVIYWQSGLYFFAFGLLYWLFLTIFELPEIVVGVAFGGFIISIMNGMLYKIVPFLTWFHLSSKGVFDIPTMREMINDKRVIAQRYLHTISFILLIVALLIENFLVVKLASLLFALSNILLFLNLYSAVKIYLKYKK